MARARNIKPSFFKNEKLAELSPYAQLLFIGLWTIADRAGRLEHRTRRVKAELFPYIDLEIESFISDLEKNGFLILYSVGEDKYIQIVNFEKQQSPHIREQPSTIPAPDMHGTSPPSTLNPPSPKPLTGGVSKDFGVFRIEHSLTFSGRKAAEKLCAEKNLDFKFAVAEFDGWVKSPPADADAAFLGFIRKKKVA